MNDSNGDDYSTDFEPHHVPSRNHEHIKRTESQESVEIEIRLSDSGKIKSRDMHLRKFKPLAFVLKIPEKSEVQGPNNTTNTNNTSLSQGQLNKQIN